MPDQKPNNATTSSSGGLQIDVTYAMACFNAGPFLDEAITSALAQHDVGIELLIVDDGSTDGSYEVAQAAAERDPRIRVFQTAVNAGPAGARNVALREMRGDWFAVLDSDDVIDPERTRALLEIADRSGSDIVADNLLEFGEGLGERSMFDFDVGGGWRFLSLDEYFERSRLFGKNSSPGFLKPMIRKRAIELHGISYNEDMRIGEDDELIVKALAAGCRYAVTDAAHYRYRKHADSISHRLSADHADRMIRAEKDIRAAIGPKLASSAAYIGRWKSLERGRAFVRSIDRLKDGDPIGAVMEIARHPSAILLYRMPIASRMRRIVGRR